MTQDKHTKGPWDCREKSIHPNPYVCGPEQEYEFGADRPVICYIVGANQSANARLIAAAPDMLEALRDALDDWEIHNRSGDGMQGDWVHDARASIAKATGQ